MDYFNVLLCDAQIGFRFTWHQRRCPSVCCFVMLYVWAYTWTKVAHRLLVRTRRVYDRFDVEKSHMIMCPWWWWASHLRKCSFWYWQILPDTWLRVSLTLFLCIFRLAFGKKFVGDLVAESHVICLFPLLRWHNTCSSLFGLEVSTCKTSKWSRCIDVLTETHSWILFTCLYLHK